MVVKNFNGGICYFYINFLFDVFIRKFFLYTDVDAGLYIPMPADTIYTSQERAGT